MPPSFRIRDVLLFKTPHGNFDEGRGRGAQDSRAVGLARTVSGPRTHPARPRRRSFSRPAPPPCPARPTRNARPCRTASGRISVPRCSSTWEARCCISDLDVPELLRASHPKPLARTSDEECPRHTQRTAARAARRHSSPVDRFPPLGARRRGGSLNWQSEPATVNGFALKAVDLSCALGARRARRCTCRVSCKAVAEKPMRCVT